MTGPGPSRAPLLSLVVLGWNNLELTQRCVDSLRRNTNVDHELVMVDNGSSDGSAEFARSAADTAVLHESNLGFAAGMNSGLGVASGRYVAFINNDTVFPEAWAGKIVETLDSNQSAGIVAPAVTAAGNPVTVRDRPGSEVEILTPFGEFPSGVVYVIPTALMRALGGWNEDYAQASSEDLDLAFTIWTHGYDVVLDARVLVDHVSQASVRHIPERKELYRANLEQFLARWEAMPLGDRPRAGSLGPEEFLANQRCARTAVVWIRRMLEARGEARELRSQVEAVGSEKAPNKGWFRPRS